MGLSSFLDGRTGCVKRITRSPTNRKPCIFSFLAPCPASGLIINGDHDELVPPDAIYRLVDRLSIQKGVKIDIDIVSGANHFFTDHLETMIAQVSGYLDTAFVDRTTNEPDFDPLA